MLEFVFDVGLRLQIALVIGASLVAGKLAAENCEPDESSVSY